MVLVLGDLLKRLATSRAPRPEDVVNVDLRYGRLTVELPANLGRAVIGGEVDVGAFTYCNHSCEIGDTELGRYCSIGQHVILAPGEHPLHSLSTHPFASDPTGVSAGLADSPEYQGIACTD